MKKKAIIILPTYNEVENIPVIIPLIFDQVPKIDSHELHLLVVDDNSPDGTQEAVKKCMEDFPNLHLITGRKGGLGEAYKRGISYALERFNPDLIFQMDADLQHDPALIPVFITLANHGFSLIIGSRFVPGGNTPNFSLQRRLLSLIGNWLVRFFGGLPAIHDCTSGYRCIKADLLRRCHLSHLSTRGYPFYSSLLVELLRNRARVIEIPITFPGRTYGESKLTFRDQVEFLLNLVRICFVNSAEFIKFCLVGSSGVIVNMGLFFYLTRKMGIPLQFASPVAIESSILSNFIFNNFWTFRKRQTETTLARKLTIYHIISSLGAIINYTLVIVLTIGFGVWDIFSNLIGIAAGVLITYYMNSLWNWKAAE